MEKTQFLRKQLFVNKSVHNKYFKRFSAVFGRV